MAKISTSTEKSSMDFEQAISLTGYGLFNIILLLSAGLCLMVVIIETMGMMFVIPGAQCDLNLSLDQKSLLSAISFLGVVSSSHLWGFIADTRGRKNVLLISMITSFLTTFVASLLVLAYGSPSVVAAICIYLLPESPKYLVTQGYKEDALNIMKKIYRINTGNDEDSFPVADITLHEISAGIDKKKEGIFKSMWKQTVPLFKSPFLLKTVMVCILQFGTFATTSGLFMWYPQILNKMTYFLKMNPGEDVSMCEAIEYSKEEIVFVPVGSPEMEELRLCNDDVDENVFVISLCLGAAFAVLYIIIGSVINIVGNKNLLVGFLTVASACGLASQYVEGVTYVQGLIGIFLLAGTCIGILNAVIVDLFPTQLRAMALAISLMAGRLGAMAGSHVSGPIIMGFCEYTFYIFTADHIVLIIIIFLLPSASSQEVQPKDAEEAT